VGAAVGLAEAGGTLSVVGTGVDEAAGEGELDGIAGAPQATTNSATTKMGTSAPRARSTRTPHLILLPVPAGAQDSGA
jgi:hypothetical protein